LDAMPAETTLLGQLLELLGIDVDRARAAASGEDGLTRLLTPALRGVPASLLLAPSVPQARLDFAISEED
jgi:hypothetical protein